MPIMSAHALTFIFGLLGNIVSFMVYLAPLPTFVGIFKKKSTEGFQSIPYSVALFSAMLIIYYAFLKPTNGFMLITINSIGSFIEAIYLIIFWIYATKSSKIQTAKLIIFFNGLLFGAILGSTLLFIGDTHRVTVVGWICAIFSVIVFAAPLTIMRVVIKTKSVEYMPFTLSLCLTLCAVIWFCYGLLIKDYYIALPNVLGFSFGIAQMILYLVYKNSKKILPECESQVEMNMDEKAKNLEKEIVIVIPPPQETTEMKETVEDDQPKVVIVISPQDATKTKETFADDQPKVTANDLVKQNV